MEPEVQTLDGTLWLSNHLGEFQQLTNANQPTSTDIIANQNQSIGFQDPGNILWTDNQPSPHHSPHTGSPASPNCKSPEEYSTVPTHHTILENPLKRRSDEPIEQMIDPDRKYARRNGSVNNSLNNGWATQVEELAENLVADFDGSLSAIAASDLVTAVASYSMSLNTVAQRNLNVATTPNGNVGLVEADSNNNGPSASASGLQFLYTNTDEYPAAPSSAGNHVSSSSQPNNDEGRFQYVLAAATSMATKLTEETLTYLNQSQSYEIKVKKLGDLSAYRGKILKTSIRICFHERRLQYTEKEQIVAWERTRPGERLLDVDVPLSYGIVEICQPLTANNCIEFLWDPTKEVGVYIKINCISTEFTPKKHGGEKGVPFKIQVETHFPGGSRLHAASCQVKVFKLKGADRKHKQDREKILRRPDHEKETFQPTYECTILSDIPLESLSPPSTDTKTVSTYPVMKSEMKPSQTCVALRQSPASPLDDVTHQHSLIQAGPSTEIVRMPSPKAPSMPSPQNAISTVEPLSSENLSEDAGTTEVGAWLRSCGFQSLVPTFATFSASDLLRLSRDDVIQICGLPDGIRLFNALHAGPPSPKLCLYVSNDRNAPLWRAVYLRILTSSALIEKLAQILQFPAERLNSIEQLGPQGIRVAVTDEVISHMRDKSMFVIETNKDRNNETYTILLKPV